LQQCVVVAGWTEDYGLDIAQIARLLVGFEYRANGEQFVCAPE